MCSLKHVFEHGKLDCEFVRLFEMNFFEVITGQKSIFPARIGCQKEFDFLPNCAKNSY